MDSDSILEAAVDAALRFHLPLKEGIAEDGCPLHALEFHISGLLGVELQNV